MLDLTQTIVQAEKLGYAYFSSVMMDYFDFPRNRVSVPFSNYIHSLTGFHFLAGLIKETLSEQHSNIKKYYKNLESDAPVMFTKTGETTPLEDKYVVLFKQEFGTVLSSIEMAQEIFLSMYVVSLVSKFEAYIQDIVVEISKYYPVTMRSGRTVNLNEVLQFKKMSSLIEHLAESASSQTTDGKASDYIRQLGDKFGIPISQFKELISEVEYFVEIRHIQVHKNGIIDSQFHRRYPNAGKTGESIKLSLDLLAQMSRVFRFMVNLIEIMLIEKFPKTARVRAVIKSNGIDIDKILVELEKICESERNSLGQLVE